MLYVAFDNLALLHILHGCRLRPRQSTECALNHDAQFLQCVFTSHRFLGNRDRVQTDFLVDIGSQTIVIEDSLLHRFTH